MLIEQLQYNMLFRWFVGMEMDEAVWNHAVYTELPLAARTFTQRLTLSSGAFAPIADNAAFGLNSYRSTG
jgi:Transposase domain (DUF772)